MAELHREISEEGHALLAERLPRSAASGRRRRRRAPPTSRSSASAALLPGAADVGRVLGEHPRPASTPSPRSRAHRWDWRLYFDADRSAPDKIYSRWGGFLDDLLFDPLRYGIPPRALEALDPVAAADARGRAPLPRRRRASVDGRSRERMSVILGASGGAGDVGAQYAVRCRAAALHRRARSRGGRRALPEWTEDTFPGSC